MPFPNEHAARLALPSRFASDSFRRTRGGVLYGRIHVPQTIGIIWGKLKGRTKPSDPVMAQALRFPVSSWSVTTARAWLSRNRIRAIMFEPASTGKESVLDSFNALNVKVQELLATMKRAGEEKL